MQSKVNQRRRKGDQNSSRKHESLSSSSCESCLLCSSPTRANSLSNFHKLPGCEGSQLLNQQMWSIFVLRNLLQYPDQNFSTLMQETFGFLNPGSWFDLCDACATSVESAMAVYSKLLRLEDELNILRIKIGKVMEMSLKIGKDNDGLESKVSPREKIREYYKDKSSRLQSLTLIPKLEAIDEDDTAPQLLNNADSQEEYASNELFDDNEDSFGNDEDMDKGGNVESNKLTLKRHPRKEKLTKRKGHSDIKTIESNSKSSVDSYIKDGKYYCPMCPVTFAWRGSLLKHLRGHRRKKYVFKCKLCSFPASTINALRLHMKKLHSSHNGESEVPSMVDGLSGENQHDQIKMQYPDWMKDRNQSSSDSSEGEQTNPKKGRILTCQLCGRIFTNTESLKRHERLHVTNKHLQCPKCNYPAVNQSGLDKHLKYKLCEQKRLQKSKIYKCDTCKFVTKRRYKFEAHVSVHKEQISSSMSNIFKKFARKPVTSSGVQHRKEKNVAKALPNRNINYDFLTIKKPDSLDRYKKDDQYHCPLCPVTFRNRQTFLVHLRDHRRKKYVFKCKLCPFPAPTFQKLRLHMQRMHSNLNGKSEEIEVSNLFNGILKSDPGGNENSSYENEISTGDTAYVIDENQSSSDSSEEEQTKKNSKKGHHVTCIVCGRTFTNTDSFRRHERLHVTCRHPCPKCNYPADSQRALDTHLRNNGCEKKSGSDFKCNLCDFITNRRFKLDAHVSNHKAKMSTGNKVKVKLPCTICNRTFSDQGAFRTHVNNHEMFKEFTCPTCNYPCASSGALKNHQRRSECGKVGVFATDPFQCEMCPFSTNSNSFFERHKETHKIYDGCETADGQWKCNICENDMIFSGRRRLADHKRLVHGSEIGLPIFQCSECPNFYARKATLDFHFNQVHKNNCKFYCEFCGYGANIKTTMTIHRAKHFEERPHVCEHCGTSFKYPSTLTTHVKKMHSGNRKTSAVVCKYCETEFPNKGLLNMHFRDAHGDLYTHKCDECDNAYMSVASLQLHKKVHHEGNRRAECQFCGATVTSRIYLYAHYKACKKKPPGFKYTVPRGGKSKNNDNDYS